MRCYTERRRPPPDTGTTRGDVRALVDDLVAIVTDDADRVACSRSSSPPAPASPSSTSPTARSSPTSGRAARAVVRRGIERGDFRADVDVELVVDAFVSPVFYRFLVTNAPLDDAFVAAIVDTTMRAFGT